MPKASSIYRESCCSKIEVNWIGVSSLNNMEGVNSVNLPFKLSKIGVIMNNDITLNHTLHTLHSGDKQQNG